MCLQGILSPQKESFVLLLLILQICFGSHLFTDVAELEGDIVYAPPRNSSLQGYLS